MPNPAILCVWIIDIYIHTYLYAVMEGPLICSSINWSFILSVCKRQNKLKTISIKVFVQQVYLRIDLMSHIKTEDCVFDWPERPLGLVVNSAQLWLKEVWGTLPVCIFSQHHSGTKCCRKNLCVKCRQKHKAWDTFKYCTQHSVSLVSQQKVTV